MKALVLLLVAVSFVLLGFAARRWSSRMQQSGRTLSLRVRLAGCLGFVAIGVALVIWPSSIATQRRPPTAIFFLGWCCIVVFGYAFVAQYVGRRRTDRGVESGPHLTTTRGLESLPLDSPRMGPEHSGASSPIARLRTEEFKLSLRGYDVDAVDAYLEDLAVSLEGGESRSPPPSPEEIERQTFKLSLRGYSERDVAAFLKSVAEELRMLPYS